MPTFLIEVAIAGKVITGFSVFNQPKSIEIAIGVEMILLG